MKEQLKKALKNTFHTAAILLLAVIAIVFVLSKIKGKPIFLFGKATMWVMTDSMDPAIPSRTYILVEKVTADDVKENDIISFISTDPSIQGQLNTHRVIKKEGNVFVTKGDNNYRDDGAYSAKAENIVARYVRTLPVMTFFGRIVLSRAGFVLVMLIFIALVLVCYLPDLKTALKKQEEKTAYPDIDEKTRKEIDKLVEEELKKLKAQKKPENINEPQDGENGKNV